MSHEAQLRSTIADSTKRPAAHGKTVLGGAVPLKSSKEAGVALPHLPLDAALMRNGPSFSLRNRFERAFFIVAWALLASWTPPPMHGWRCGLLRAFGAKIGRGVRLYGSTIIWLPANLIIEKDAVIGPRTRLYNQGTIMIGERTVISQGAHICASSHDVNDRDFQLVLRPISIGPDVWIAAEAFVGPGVSVGEGAVLGARGVAMRDLETWTVYSGNPATALKPRAIR